MLLHWVSEGKLANDFAFVAHEAAVLSTLPRFMQLGIHFSAKQSQPKERD